MIGLIMASREAGAGLEIVAYPSNNPSKCDWKHLEQEFIDDGFPFVFYFTPKFVPSYVWDLETSEESKHTPFTSDTEQLCKAWRESARKKMVGYYGSDETDKRLKEAKGNLNLNVYVPEVVGNEG